MSFQELILTYGYPMLFLGVLIESEAVLLIGVYLAQQGYFSLPIVIGVAALSSFLAAQFCFFVGHRYGATFLVKRPNWQLRFSRVQRLMNRFGIGLVLGFRVIYGLRGVIPAAIGLADYSRLVFIGLNAMGALLWAVAVGLAGSSFVHIAEHIFAKLSSHSTALILVLCGLSLCWGMYRFYRHLQREKSIIP
ncbi:DedA family protein [Spirosoma sp. HMF3257]|uniref:DedA family protein n=2 Tax=Spirosoma telluris TaxID=2183553 RepID=A0A327NTG1_9BACT|nr:DedA family protein [Spirosoma telluris]RAI78681.1 DedA family protein [Spirosoma telluris]